MKGLFKSDYTNDGNKRAVYIVKGTKAELDAYEKAVNDNDSGFEMATDEKTGEPLFFGKRLGPSCVIEVSDNGFINAFNKDAQAITESIGMYEDDAEMQKALRDAAAQAIIAKALGGSPSRVAAPAQPEAASEDVSTEETEAEPEL